MIVSGVKRSMAFARFPGLIRDAMRSFERLEGLTAVSTFGSASAEGQGRRRLLPPVHPLCAKLLRETVQKSPCEAEWQKHLQFAERMGCCRIHTCPLGLRCACLPIAVGEEFLGLVKFVSPAGIPKKRFRSLVGLLEDLIARPCQELQVFLLREEIQALQSSVTRLRQAKRPAWPTRELPDLSATNDQVNGQSPQAQTLISQVLGYLNEHFADRELSLVQVACAVGRNEKYVSHLFTQQVGRPMRPYITSLRVRRACELLLQTSRTIEQIACDSGFASGVQFRQAFHRTIGVTASEYRQIFTPA